LIANLLLAVTTQIAARTPTQTQIYTIDRARGSRRSSATRIVFSSGTRYRPAIGSHGGTQPGQILLARLIHYPTAVNRSFPATVNAQTAIAIRQASR